MPDAAGNPYALVAETQPGDLLVASGNVAVLPSIPEGTVLEVYMTTGPSPRLCVMAPEGEHDLAGELNADGTWHGGLSEDGTEYLGFYKNTTSEATGDAGGAGTA